MSGFPVDGILPSVAASLAAGRSVVLQAPPGSGKTTRVAPYLLDAPWLRGRKILMLEPRRLAARAAAGYMARQRGESVGDTVGYRVRLDNKTGPKTRIEILTEGLLTQRLLRDPELAEAGLVVFDEFHERSLAADMGLALALDSRGALRPDLRIIVMSATLDPAPIAAHLGNADIHTASARMFPVETRLLRNLPDGPVAASAADAVCRALEAEGGSVLVFLPGEGEIRSTAERLSERRLPPDVHVFPLYGALDRREQDRAIEPSPPGERKVVLATSIAESSLTIEGIRVVIDSGWMRVPRFSPRNGMSRLVTLRITRDRADQRRGRAGRVCPGVCYRLWDEATDRQLAPETEPEILEADLAPTVLQCADWGTTRRDGLPWLTLPPDASWRQGVALLQNLGALGKDSAITPRGRRLVQIPVHPRLAQMIEMASGSGPASLRRACELAAAVTESPSIPGARRETDLRRILDWLRRRPDDPAARPVFQLAENWGRSFRCAGSGASALSEGALLAWAFPDRVAKRRNAESGTYLMRCGNGAVLAPDDPLIREEWLVAAELQDGSADAKIRLAVPVSLSEIEGQFAGEVTSETVTEWDARTESVRAMRRRKLGALTLSEGNERSPDPELVRKTLMDAVRRKGVSALPWSKSALALQARVNFLHRLSPDPPSGWPDFSGDALAATLSEWFEPFCANVSRWSQVQELDLTQMLLTRLDLLHCSRSRLDALAPTHVAVPSGSNIQIHYETGEPYLSVRIQEVFGLMHTPRVADGRVPVVMHLLSPAQRPVQVTSDLESFWATGYALVRKDLRGRYPKHYWPEDPSQATPTRRVRPRGA
jgi:ATP-dependent helicase HrpB